MRGNTRPLISVIIPYYNPRFDYFKLALESVLSQSYPNWELVIVNDGSNNENRAFLEKLVGELNGNRIKIVHHLQNRGLPHTRNTGIKSSEGNIICFLDHDDLLLPWHLEELTFSFSQEANSLITAFYQFHYLDLFFYKKLCINKGYLALLDNFEKTSGETKNKIKTSLLGYSPRFAFRRELLSEITFDTTMPILDDTDFWFQVLNNEEIFSKVIFQHPHSYIYRNYLSKKRLLYWMEDKYVDIERLVSKYKTNGKENKERTYANILMDRWLKSYDEIRLYKPFLEYIKKGSLIQFVLHTLRSSCSYREKLRDIKGFFKLVLEYRVLIPVFGLNFRHIKLLFDVKDSTYKKEAKNKFLCALEETNDECVRYYGKKVFDKLFK